MVAEFPDTISNTESTASTTVGGGKTVRSRYRPMSEVLPQRWFLPEGSFREHPIRKYPSV